MPIKARFNQFESFGSVDSNDANQQYKVIQQDSEKTAFEIKDAQNNGKIG
jgi:hypothetical protein